MIHLRQILFNSDKEQILNPWAVHHQIQNPDLLLKPPPRQPISSSQNDQPGAPQVGHGTDTAQPWPGSQAARGAVFEMEALSPGLRSRAGPGPVRPPGPAEPPWRCDSGRSQRRSPGTTTRPQLGLSAQPLSPPAAQTKNITYLEALTEMICQNWINRCNEGAAC